MIIYETKKNDTLKEAKNTLKCCAFLVLGEFHVAFVNFKFSLFKVKVRDGENKLNNILVGKSAVRSAISACVAIYTTRKSSPLLSLYPNI